jgi:hypothetical protein
MGTSRWLGIVSLLVIGCGGGDNSPPGGSPDLSAVAQPDLSTGGPAGPDLKTAGAGCSMTPQTGDGQDCKTANCPAGTIGVNQQGGGCKCFFSCNPNNQPDCSCDRRCIPLTDNDGGAVGGACLPGNGPGVRCGTGGNGLPCAQALTCAGASGGNAYCLFDCTGQDDCPAQTQCVGIANQAGMTIGLACTYKSAAGGIATGTACQPSDVCTTGDLCNATCQMQCDGPGGTCASGTCKVVNDTTKNKVIGYTCQP